MKTAQFQRTSSQNVLRKTDSNPLAPPDLRDHAAVGRDLVSMVSILVGAALGFLSGLGVGGGSLLLLWLTLVMGLPQSTARVMNLMFFLPCALVATVFRWKTAKMDKRLLLPAMAAGLAGALIGNIIGPELDKELLRKAFGVIFLLCGARELRYRSAQKQ